MSRRRSSLFLHVKADPNPEVNPSLWEHRLRQRRPISANPFVAAESVEGPVLDGGVVGSPPMSRRATQSDDLKSDPSKEDVQDHNPNHDVEWGDQAPGWLNLFYDLAWTATFSSLTSNNKFRQPWDTVSYIVFFTVAWWMWTSQMFYSIDFYTDDWFHLLVIFLQLVIFGALAATTRGFDVSTYLLHSPGSTNWEDTNIETITPQQYGNERVARLSLTAITVVVALSRLLLLVQHIRVALYAKFTRRSKRYPLRLLIVPTALAISTALFFAAFVVTKRHYNERGPAKLKFYLWGIGLLVEVIAHMIRFQLDINDGIRLRSHGSIAGRFHDITVIILGEGINAIAGTFYAIGKAPGFGGPTAAGIISSALIVFFLAYLYFENAAPSKPIRRRASWSVVHLPWLLCVILLLEGVKNQLLVSSFMSSSVSLMGKTTDQIFNDNFTESAFNETMRPILLQGGLTLDDQWQKLINLVNDTEIASNTTDLDDQTLSELQGVWYLRMQQMIILNTYITFMDNETIADEVQQRVQQYQSNYTYAYQDLTTEQPDLLFGFIWELLHASVNNARYIMALCGLTFVWLASLNLIQSWPRDRFQWASVISRYVMGLVMILLLVLNIGKYQTYFTPVDSDGNSQDNKRAPVFGWMDTSWVLPTLALAYGTQFIIDTVIVYVAVWYTRKSVKKSEGMH